MKLLRLIIGIILGLLVAWIPAQIAFALTRANAGNEDTADLAALAVFVLGAILGILAAQARTEEKEKLARQRAAEKAEREAEKAEREAKQAREDERQRRMNEIRRESRTCFWCKVPAEFKKDGRRQVATTERRTAKRRHYDASGDYAGYSETDYEAPTTEWCDYGHYECSQCGRKWGQNTDAKEAARNARA